MITYFDCLPCFVNFALGILKRSNATDDKIKNTMSSVFNKLAAIDFNATPPMTARNINRIVCTAVHNKDPYAAEKKRFNEFALMLLPHMRRQLISCRDIFTAKVKLAIAANIIDFGKNGNLTEQDVQACFDKALETYIDKSAVSRLLQAVKVAKKVLYLCDNAGEIIFDRFLIEEMPYQKITCAVRGKPIINDATLKDAEIAGLTGIVKVISNGSDVPGTALDECSPEFIQAFNYADLVIAKGQGNFETLSEITNKRIFFLLQVKCPVIARDIGFPVGSFVIKDNCPEQIKKTN
jgi:damage-control phosphatase, subfamily I